MRGGHRVATDRLGERSEVGSESDQAGGEVPEPSRKGGGTGGLRTADESRRQDRPAQPTGHKAEATERRQPGSPPGESGFRRSGEPSSARVSRDADAHSNDTKDPKLAFTRPSGGPLRSQLLSGLAVLITLALLVLSTVLLFWLPLRPDPLALLLGVLGLVAIESGLILLAGVYLMQARLIKPLERMVEDSEAVAEGEYERRIEEVGPDEFQSLARSVNHMAGHLIHNQELLADNVRSLDDTNQALAAARQELVQSERLASVGRLAAGVAHEIGNPLGSILGYLEVARRRGANGEEWVAEIEGEVDRINRVVRGLLDFARPREPEVESVHINELTDGVIELLESQGRLKEVTVKRDLSLEVPVVEADPALLEQVLLNVLLNARDAIEEADRSGEIRVRTSLAPYDGPGKLEPPRRGSDPKAIDYSHLRTHRKDPNYRPPPFRAGDPTLKVEVHDNGVGIDPENRERVFEPFYTTKEPGRGTGLGLAVSARIIEELGGVITVSSSPEEGTCFAVFLPLERARVRPQDSD